MKHKVWIRRIERIGREDDSWQVHFTVGVQTFSIGLEQDTEEEAAWLARMFRLALRNMRAKKEKKRARSSRAGLLGAR